MSTEESETADRAVNSIPLDDNNVMIDEGDAIKTVITEGDTGDIVAGPLVERENADVAADQVVAVPHSSTEEKKPERGAAAENPLKEEEQQSSAPNDAEEDMIDAEEDIVDAEEDEVDDEKIASEEGHVAEEQADEEEEEEEGETRCICNELDPPDESGLFIQCEECGVWQHGFCVGIVKDDTPDKYWCEQCKPELHHLYVTDLGDNRSIYKPVQGSRRERKRLARQTSNSNKFFDNEENKNDAKGEDTNATETDDVQSKKNKTSESSSPTSNSTTDISSNAIPSNFKEDIATTRTKKSRSFSEEQANNKNEEDVTNTEDTTENNDDNDDDVSGTSQDTNNNENSETPYEEDEKRLQDRKRATFIAREEKQYQRMLEKAIKESKQSSRGSEDEDVEQDDTIDRKTSPPESTLKNSPEENALPIPKTKRKHPLSTVNEEAGSYQEANETQSETATPDVSSEEGSRKFGRGKRGQRVTKRSRRSNTPTRKGTPGRRSKATRNNSSNSKNAGSNKSTTDIDVNKPVKPRLPPTRTTLNEMKRRVAAILEFISRTQWELGNDQQSKEELVKFVENEQFIQKVDSIYEKYDESLVIMDELTRSLLNWEEKYS